MKSVLALLIAFVAVTGLATAQFTETFDGATTGSTTASLTCASTGGWGYPACWDEATDACSGGNHAFRPDGGGTGSAGTGPSDDVTGGGLYMYCETSVPGSAATFELVSPPLDIGGGTMDFFYNMNGATIGTLDVQESNDRCTWNTIFTVSGDMGDVWINSGALPLAASTRFVRFLYAAGGGFTGDAAIDEVTFSNYTGAVPGPAIANANDAEASLTLNGGTAFAGCAGDAVTIAFSSNAPTGVAHDIAVSCSPLLACPIPLLDDSIEIDLGSGSTFSLFGGPVVFPFAPFGLGLGGGSYSITLSAPPGDYNLQAGIQQVATVDPDGISLTEVCTYSAAPIGIPQTQALGDDSFVNIDLTGTPPYCVSTSVTLYSVVYTDIFVNSNGDVSFTAGHTDFGATLSDWTAGFPRIGCHTDWSPNAQGSVDVTVTANGIVSVDYTNMGEFPGGGGDSTSYTVAFSAGAAAITGFTTTGITTDSVFGISDGGTVGATHPGHQSFDLISAPGGGTGVGFGLATDSWTDVTVGGTPVGAGTNWTNVIWPTANGSVILVN